MNKTYCAEVLSLAAGVSAQPESGVLSGDALGRPSGRVKVVLIDITVDCFFLERLTDTGELVGEMQYDTLDEAMWQAYSDYVLSDWSFCPDGVDPLEYIRAQSDA